MQIRIKNISYFFLFLYLIAISAYQLGTGFDAIFVRLTFILLFFSSLFLSFKITIIEIFKWLILFWIYYYLSIIWAQSSSDTLYYLTQTIQIIGLAFCIPNIMKEKKDIKIVLNLILLSVLYASILLIIRTPANHWGTERIGEVIGLYSNALGTRLAISSIIALYLFKDSLREKNKVALIFYFVCLILFVFLNLFTGSRKSLLVSLLGLTSYELLSTKGIKIFLKFILIILLIYGVFYFIYNNPQMYNIIGRRINAFVTSIVSNSNKDGSLAERIFYISVAKYLFRLYPILGIGGNNFVTYLRTIDYSHIAYSHNNYYELLSTLGIIGFIIYYYMWVKSLIKLFKIYKLKHNNLILLMLVILVLFILSDWFTVSYITDFNQLLFIVINVCIINMEKSKGENYNEKIIVENN